ncbi:MAG: choice-of-anchor I family protein [Pseudomonadota bacterium]
MSNLVIFGVVDGPLSGGTPKAVALLALNDIANLSVYGIESANNGNASSGAEFTFPADSASAGDIITVASEEPQFMAYFGTAPSYSSAALSINGDDALILFESGGIVDVFGEVGTDGGGTWEHSDSFALRNDMVPSASFDLSDWTIATPDTLDGTTTAPANLLAAFGGEDGGSGGSEPTVATIMEIQGAGHVSPFVLDDSQDDAAFFADLPGDVSSIPGGEVSTSGIVTATDTNGFYLQDPNGDEDAATSDAIFVFTGSAPGVEIGDLIELTATVSEFFPGGSGSGNLPTTQLSNATISVISSENPLPAATILGEAGRTPPTERIDGADGFGSFEPDSDGVDFFESVEGMRVTIEDAVAVSGTSRFGEIFAVANGGDGASGLSERGTLNIAPGDFNPEKIQIDEDSGVFNFDFPEVAAGAQLGNVTGVVSYSFGNYEVLPTEDFTPQIVASPLTPEVSEITGSDSKLTIASYNVLNLDPKDEDPALTDQTDGRFSDDTDDDVGDGRFAAIAEQIVTNLNAPDIIGLQEIQNEDGTEISDVATAAGTLQLLIDEIAAAGGPTYEFIDTPDVPVTTAPEGNVEGGSLIRPVGGAPGGDIRNGFLYNPERVSLKEGAVQKIADDDGDAFPFLGGRIPLVATFDFGGEEVTVVNNHFSSKGGSAPIMGTSQSFGGLQEDPDVNGSLDERQAQAQAVNDFVDGILAEDADANVVVLGDMNEFEFVSPLGILAGEQAFDGTTVSDTPEDQILENLTDDIAPNERYSFIFQGNSQQLDHILATPGLAENAEIDIVNVNVEFAETAQRASDHDPVLASFDFDLAPASGVELVARGGTGIFDDSSAEIIAHEDGRFFVSNAEDGTIDVYERFGEALVEVDEISNAALGGDPNSVDVKDGVVAVAIEAETITDNGTVKLFDAKTLEELASFDALGALPDMLTFSRDGTQLFVAIEGEPNSDYSIDPVGGVTIIDLDSDDLGNSTATFVGFEAFNGQEDALRAEGVRIFGPNASAAQDLEPEYIAEGDGQLAVTLQENNSLALIDLETKSVVAVKSLGVKDHSVEGNGLDSSDRDEAINIATKPIFGLYQPDAIASYQVNGQTYYVTANEGDAREYDGFEEEVDVAEVTLDPTAFPDADELQSDAVAGRLNITNTLGDTDGDGDFDELYAFGGRSFSIWDAEGNLVYDSGDMLEQLAAQFAPEQFNANNDGPFDFDNRSDNKGPEPEAVAIAEIEGRQVAIVGLERQNALVFFDVSDPTAPEFLKFINTTVPTDDATGEPFPLSDLGPESIEVIAPEESESGLLEIAVANEVSGSVSLYTVSDLFEEDESTFTLEMLHVADQEAGAAALQDTPRLSAVMNALEAQDLGDDGLPDNTIRLSSGDAFIPGLFFGASEALFGAGGIADIQIQNELGLQAIALGNHEFDFGTGVLSGLIDGSAGGSFELPEDPAFEGLSLGALEGQDFEGALFPYLSANLSFGSDENLAQLEVEGGGAPLPNSVTSSTVIDVNGENIGVVGATTPTLGSISNPGGVGISPSPFDLGSPTEEQLDALAAQIQAEVDALLAADPTLNKVIVLSHMQQLSIEEALAERLTDVDIIVAGGSNTRLFDDTDRPRDGDSDQGQYPLEEDGDTGELNFITGADGTPTAVVNTDGSYKYVGRLVIDFDENGVIIPESYDEEVSGAYATDAQGVADLGAEDLVDTEIQALVDAVGAQIFATESNVFGVSDVFLNGNRQGIDTPDDPDGVRTQETNLGNLTADANLAYAHSIDDTVVISLKNGGGIRASIGQTIVPPGGTEAERTPNEEILDEDGNVVKPEGGISENDIKNVLAFNNSLTLVTLQKSEIIDLLEHGVSGLPAVPGDAEGRFPQISGVTFSFDETLPIGSRILNAAIVDEDGTVIEPLMIDGEIAGDATQEFRIVTLGFLANPRFDENTGEFIGGGDGYPFPNLDDPEVAARANPVDLEQEGVRTGDASFADDGTEQDVLAEYLDDNFNPENGGTAFVDAETGRDGDERIQNVAFRDDTIFADGIDDMQMRFVGTFADDVFEGGDADDSFLLRFGTDEATGNGGADAFVIDSRYVAPGDTHTITDFDSSEGDTITFRFFDTPREVASDEDLQFYIDNGFATVTATDGTSKSITFQNLDQNFGSEDERFVGTRADDSFDGEGGADTFLLRNGNDTATGGADADSFIFDSRYVGTGSEHTVTDLNFGEGDQLVLRFFGGGTTTVGSETELLALDSESFASVTDTGASTLLTLVNAGGDSMEIELFQTMIA